VAIGGGKNAGILALQILGLGDRALQERILAYKSDLAEMARAQSVELTLPSTEGS
jgi:5-(carboxyamino)imidazole ribonucleotide mutase